MLSANSIDVGRHSAIGVGGPGLDRTARGAKVPIISGTTASH